MSTPMSGRDGERLDLEAIRKRRERGVTPSLRARLNPDAQRLLDSDIPLLIAEVERLRAERGAAGEQRIEGWAWVGDDGICRHSEHHPSELGEKGHAHRVIIHNAGASVPELLLRPKAITELVDAAIDFGVALGREQFDKTDGLRATMERARDAVSVMLGRVAMLRAGADVEGPSEPATEALERYDKAAYTAMRALESSASEEVRELARKRLSEAVGGYATIRTALAAPATQEAPSEPAAWPPSACSPEEGLRSFLARLSDDAPVRIGSTTAPLHMIRRALAAPSAPQEPPEFAAIKAKADALPSMPIEEAVKGLDLSDIASPSAPPTESSQAGEEPDTVWTGFSEEARRQFPATAAMMARLEKRLLGGRVWDADFHELSKRIRPLVEEVLSYRRAAAPQDERAIEAIVEEITAKFGWNAVAYDSGTSRAVLRGILRAALSTTPGTPR